jgi:hypothetical protein
MVDKHESTVTETNMYLPPRMGERDLIQVFQTPSLRQSATFRKQTFVSEVQLNLPVVELERLVLPKAENQEVYDWKGEAWFDRISMLQLVEKEIELHFCLSGAWLWLSRGNVRHLVLE